MLRLTLSIIPRGDERTARELGTVEIENDCTGTEEIGNYEVRARGFLHRDARVVGFSRSWIPWRLALAALKELLDG